MSAITVEGISKRFGAEAAVDDAKAAFLCHHGRHRGTRDGVHVGRHDRPVQRQAPGEARPEIDRPEVAARSSKIP